jgi:hypothetical protein
MIRATHMTRITAICVLALATIALSACAGSRTPASTNETTSTPAGSGGMTSATGQAPTDGIVRPEAPTFETPVDAVKSYLDWVTYAYEMANSDVATMTFSPDEEVRVNSYVQFNKEKNQRIRQRLIKFTPGGASKVGTTTVLPASETWQYQYLDLTTARTVTPTYTVSYETTYTLIRRDGDGWVVHKVEAQPLGEVK